jgi:hypothetical protein
MAVSEVYSLLGPSGLREPRNSNPRAGSKCELIGVADLNVDRDTFPLPAAMEEAD